MSASHAEFSSTDGMWFQAAIFGVMSLLVGAYFPLRLAAKWQPFVSVAENVFRALGYKNPAGVDLERQNSLYWKTMAKSGEERQVSPWVYRYVDER